MGMLTWSINVTLDGCCDHTQVIADAELHHYATGRGPRLLDGAAVSRFRLLEARRLASGVILARHAALREAPAP